MMRNRIKGTSPKPWGICQRSGLRFYLSELVRDGLYPDMLVHPKYWEPPERKGRYRPRADEFALRNPSPDNSRDVTRITWPGIDTDTMEPLGTFLISISSGEITIPIESLMLDESGGLILSEDGNSYLETEDAA